MRHIIISLLAAVALFTGCRNNAGEQQSAAIEKDSLVQDKYGVNVKINPDKKVVYLVFTAHFSENDNGRFENFDGIVPVLDILKEKDVKGSFFPTGKCFLQEKYQEPLRRIIDEGHYLSAHSFAHLLLCDENDRSISLVGADSIAKDFAKMEEQLQRFGLTKEQYNTMIPPYETYNNESVEAMKALGFNLINPTPGMLNGMDWTTPGEPGYVSSAQILEHLWNYEKENGLNGFILLVHAMDYPDRTNEDRVYTHLPEIIDTLREKGYTFATVKDVKFE